MLYINRFIELNWQDLAASSRSCWANSWGVGKPVKFPAPKSTSAVSALTRLWVLRVSYLQRTLLG